MSLAVIAGGVALEALKMYTAAKSAQAAATVNDQAAIAELDRQIAANVAGANAAEAVLDADLGIVSDDVTHLGDTPQL
jgi:hypothetical protein